MSLPNLIQDSLSGPRLVINDLLASDGQGSAAAPLEGQDVITGLSAQAKSLPPKYFYDARGSQLFDQICELSEYYPTRTEAAILRQHGGAIARTTGPCQIIELGSGSATKARILLSAYEAAGHPLRYVPIDVSSTALKESAQQLLKDYPTLSIQGLVSTYELALSQIASQPNDSQMPARLICFLGSTIGNFKPDEYGQFLNKVSAALRPGDYFLLGIDLQKEASVLEAAYNDSLGITAEFNLNMLRHLNHRFEGNFNLENFSHNAIYNSEKHQIEMYIESAVSQTVTLKALDYTTHFAAQEKLLSEVSRKFNLKETAQQLAARQLSVLKTFTDEKQWFGLLLCQRTAVAGV